MTHKRREYGTILFSAATVSWPGRDDLPSRSAVGRCGSPLPRFYRFRFTGVYRNLVCARGNTRYPHSWRICRDSLPCFQNHPTGISRDDPFPSRPLNWEVVFVDLPALGLLVSLVAVLACFGLVAYLLRTAPAHSVKLVVAITSLIGSLTGLVYAVRG